jgi:CO/xanthine dehydrogenase Mo-binding subunit
MTKQRLLELAVSPGSRGAIMFPDKMSEDLDIRNSIVFEKANPDNKKTVKEVVQNYETWGSGEGHLGPAIFIYDLVPRYTGETYPMGRSVFFHEVEVDPDTGKVDITKIVFVSDAGRVICPESYEGQQYGGVYMGFGRSNTEAIYYDPQTGKKLNEDHIGYAISLMNDCPIVDCQHIETGFAFAPYGAFGIGEQPNASSSSSTYDAVYNAIGKWVDSLPTTPDKILKALAKA